MRAKSVELRAKSQEFRAESRGQRAQSIEQNTSRSTFATSSSLSALSSQLVLVAVSVLFTLSSLLAIAYTRSTRVQAAPNSTINFQARILTASGAVVPDGSYNVQFNLYSVSSGGSTLWTESYLNSATQGIVTKNGYITAPLGSITAFPATINWDQELWIGITIRGTGSCAFGACTPTDAEMTPRMKVTAVPYAFRAEKALNVASNNTSTASTNSNNVSVTSGNATGATSNSGTVTVDSGTATGTAGSIYIGNVNAAAVYLGRTGTNLMLSSNTLQNLTTGLTVDVSNASNSTLTITNSGAGVASLSVEGGGSFGGNLTVSSAGYFATQKGADYATTGTTNNVNLGTASLFRLTGASAQTITGIAGGADGRLITLINAGANAATIANNSASSTAANRIITGTGGDMTLASGASITMVYDSTASLWRVVGGTGGGASSIFTQATGFAYQTTTTDSFVLGGTTTATAKFYFNPATSSLYLGTDSTTSGSITLFSSGVGIADPTISADAAGNLNLSATAGAVVIGDGSGDIQFQIANLADVLLGQKSATATAASYTGNDFTFNRTVSNTNNTYANSGRVFSITDTSNPLAGTTNNYDLIYGNAAPTSGNAFSGNLLRLQTSGADRFSVNSAGNVTASGTFNTATLSGGSLSATAVNGLSVSAGTISVGTWQATAVGATYGGTGQTGYAIGDILYANTTTSLGKLAAVASGSCLISNGVSTAPSWGSCTPAGSGNYIQAQAATPGTAQNTNFNIGTGTGIAANLNATTAFLLNGTNINTAGTLTNVAYENQANTFTQSNTFSATSDAAVLNSAPAASATASLLRLGPTIAGGSANGTYIGSNPATFTGNFMDLQVGGAVRLRVTNTGATTVGNTLTVSTGGISVTGNSNIAGSLGSLTGLTSSGTITFSSLNTAGIVQTNASGVLNTSALDRNSGTFFTSALSAANGGTGQTTYAVGDLLYANTTTTIAKLAAVASGSCLISNGVSTAPSWGSCTPTGSGNYIQNQSASAQATSNFWISTTGRADTSFVSPLYASTGTGSLTVNAAGANTLLLQTNATTRFTVANNASTLTGNGATSILGGSTLNIGSGGANNLTLATNSTTRITVDTSGNTTFGTNILGASTATGTTGTTEATARTNVTTVTLTAAGAFANNDVIFINNAGQDYYTRITAGGGTTTLTVSPAVSYDASAAVTKYTIQNIGATATDYTTQANRFFQGYFTGGVVTGAGSTVYSDGMISASPGLTIRNPTNTATAFQVQTAAGANQILVNNNSTNSNLVTNPSAETDVTGWQARAGTTLTRDTSQAYYGVASAKAANTATAGAGIRYPIVLTANTAYGIHFMLKNSTGAASTLDFGYAADGATETLATCNPGGNQPCYVTAQSMTNGWVRYQLIITTPASVNGGAYLFIKQSDAVARDMWIDGLRVESGGAGQMYMEGVVSLGNNGTLVGVNTTAPTANLFVQQSSSAAGFVVRGNGESFFGKPSVFAVQDGAGNNKITYDELGNQTYITGGSSFWGTAALAVQSQFSNNPALRVRGAGGQSVDIFQVQGSGGTNLFTAGVGGVQVGSSTTDASAYLLTLDSYNNGTDPTGTNGSMYYNTSTNKFRCYQNSIWIDCAGSGAANSFIQGGNSFTATAVLGTNDAYDLQFETGGTTKVTVQNSTGNVGIGATNPGAKLEVVNGSQTIQFATGTNTSGYTLSIGANDNGVNLSTNSGVRGFNFTNPNGTLLSVTGTGDFTAGGFDLILGNRDQVSRGSSGVSRALVKNSGSQLVINYGGDFTGGVFTQSTFGANRLYAGWDSGTANAVSTSDWFRTSGNGGVYFASWGGGWHMQDATYIRAYNGKTVYSAAGYLSGNSLTFEQTNPTISAPSYFIAPGGAYFNSGTVYMEAALQARGGIQNDGGNYSGQVRIHDTLEVGGDINVNTTVRSWNAGNYIQMWSGGNGAGYFGVNSATSLLAVDAANQQVVVGDPGYYMNLRVRGTSGTLCTIGNGTGNTACTSDSRLKTIDGVAGGNLDKIMQLQPTYFKFIKDTTQRQRLGLIAQNVQSVLPEYIDVDPDGYLQLDYGALVTPLIGAVQEQQAMINQVKSDIATLQGAAGLGAGNASFVSLNVSGPTTLTDLVVNGNAIFTGNLTVNNATVNNITINGHIITAGNTPTATPGAAAGTEDTQNNVPAPTVTIDGNDTAGTITIVAGASTTAGDMAAITFASTFGKEPRIILTPVGSESAKLQTYVNSSAADGFKLGTNTAATAGTTYTYNYQIMQ